jgi:hypothetical protein
MLNLRVPSRHILHVVTWFVLLLATSAGTGLWAQTQPVPQAAPDSIDALLDDADVDGIGGDQELTDSAAHTTTEHNEHGAAGGHAAEGGLDVKHLLFHHLIDTHDWHFFDYPDASGHYHPVALRLPWIVFSETRGLQVFTLHAHEHAALAEEAKAHGYAIDEYGKLSAAGPGEVVIDFSITKIVIQMLLVGLLLLWVFGSVAKAATKRVGAAPKGKQSLFEPLILFIRDEVARLNLRDPHHAKDPYHFADKMTPYY